MGRTGSRRKTRGLLRLVRDERGVTVIEFALLGLPFFTIVAAILETTLIFFAAQILDSAVNDSARLIRTGQAQSAGYEIADYRRAICSGLYRLFDCNAVKIKVTVIDRFSDYEPGSPVATGEDCTPEACEWTLEEGFAPGVGNQVVIVEAYYRWPTLLRLPGFNMQNLPDGTRLLGAARLFQNEPFT